MFPHHECEAAQSEAATGQPFARHWMHVGMVAYEGTKMSKSLGNLVFVRNLRRMHDPRAIRLALMAHHYRGGFEWFGVRLAAPIALSAEFDVTPSDFQVSKAQLKAAATKASPRTAEIASQTEADLKVNVSPGFGRRASARTPSQCGPSLLQGAATSTNAVGGESPVMARASSVEADRAARSSCGGMPGHEVLDPTLWAGASAAAAPTKLVSDAGMEGAWFGGRPRPAVGAACLGGSPTPSVGAAAWPVIAAGFGCIASIIFSGKSGGIGSPTIHGSSSLFAPNIILAWRNSNSASKGIMRMRI